MSCYKYKNASRHFVCIYVRYTYVNACMRTFFVYSRTFVHIYICMNVYIYRARAHVCLYVSEKHFILDLSCLKGDILQ